MEKVLEKINADYPRDCEINRCIRLYAAVVASVKKSARTFHSLRELLEKRNAKRILKICARAGNKTMLKKKQVKRFIGKKFNVLSLVLVLNRLEGPMVCFSA